MRPRVPGGSFERLTEPLALWQAWRRVARGRRRRADIARFDLDADARIFDLHRRLRAGSWWPPPLRVRLVRDPKPRIVAVASVEERVVQHALLHEIEPSFVRGFRPETFACGVGRGPVRAGLAALRAARRSPWVATLDVAAYFRDIRRDEVLRLLRRRLRAPRTLALVALLLHHGDDVHRRPSVVAWSGDVADGVGIPLGSYLSHFLGGVYLDALDHALVRTPPVSGYVRYMDDLVLFGPDREELRQQVETVRAWLRDERGLTLKLGTGVVHATREAFRFLGWRVHPSGLRPSRKLRRNLHDRLRAALWRGPDGLARSLAAWRGLLTN